MPNTPSLKKVRPQTIASRQAPRFEAAVSLDKLIPWPGNPRRHGADIDRLVRSIEHFGWTNPILCQEGTGRIIAGHGRVEAARKAGVASVPVLYLDMSEQDAAAYTVADNRLAEISEWDVPNLKDCLAEMEGAGYDATLTGYSPEELDAVFNRESVLDDGPAARMDEAVALAKKWKTATGQLWIIGEHRLLCGDCTKPEDVARLLDEVKPHLMVTDPPYGVDYDPNWRNVEAADRRGLTRWTCDARRVGIVENDNRADWSDAWKLFTGDVVYCWHAIRHASLVQASLESVGFEIRSQIIWAKSNFPISRGHYHCRHEACWYAVRKGSTGHWQGARDQTTLWEINLDKNIEGGHSTQKPVQCMRRPIENNSKKDDHVYDPFVGSGTTLVAAEQTARRCYAMEIEPKYVAVTLQRLADMGMKPKVQA